MMILGLELEEWWELIKLIVGGLLTTTVLLFIGLLIHEGAHLFVAACFGCKVEFFRFTGFLGAEVGIYCGPYLVPIAFAGGFAEGLYFLVVRKYIKNQWFGIATLSCWTYAIAEVYWVYSAVEFPLAMPLLDATTILTFVIVFVGLVWPQSKRLYEFSDYQEGINKW